MSNPKILLTLSQDRHQSRASQAWSCDEEDPQQPSIQGKAQAFQG